MIYIDIYLAYIFYFKCHLNPYLMYFTIHRLTVRRNIWEAEILNEFCLFVFLLIYLSRAPPYLHGAWRVQEIFERRIPASTSKLMRLSIYGKERDRRLGRMWTWIEWKQKLQMVIKHRRMHVWGSMDISFMQGQKSYQCTFNIGILETSNTDRSIFGQQMITKLGSEVVPQNEIHHSKVKRQSKLFSSLNELNVITPGNIS